MFVTRSIAPSILTGDTNADSVRSLGAAGPHGAIRLWPLFARIVCAIAATILSVLSPCLACADVQDWTGGSTDAFWADASNWSTAVPGSDDTATFNAAAGLGGAVIDLGSSVTVNSIIFDTGNAAAYTIGNDGVSGQSLTLSDGGSITMNSNVASDELFNAALTLGTDDTTQSYTLTNDSTTNSLTFAGSIDGGAGGPPGSETLVVAGAGSTTISGSIGDGGAASVSLASSAGTLTLLGANSYSGTTQIVAGTLVAGNASALGFGGNITFSGGTLEYTSASAGQDWSTRFKNSTTAPISLNLNGLSVTLAGVIDSSNTDGLNVSGGGTLTLGTNGTANTYSGGTTFSSGTLIYDDKGAFGTGTITLAGGVTWEKNVQEGNSASLATTNDIDLSGGMVITQISFSGAKDMWLTGQVSGPGGFSVVSDYSGRTMTLAGANTFTGGIVLGGASSTYPTVQITNNASLGTGTFRSQITPPRPAGFLRAIDNNLVIANAMDAAPGAALQIDVNGNSLTLSGVISDSGSLYMYCSSGTGTLILTGSNTYTGSTDITVANGTLRLGDGTSAHDGSINDTSGVVDNGTLAFDCFAGQSIAYAISGIGGVSQLGAAMLTLAGANTYTGNTILGAGVLNLGSAQNGTVSGPVGESGSIIFAGGTLQYSAANQNDYSSRFTATNNNPYSIDTNGQNVAFASPLLASGNSGLVKLGAGSLSLTGASTYSGPTTISAGTLTLTANGSLGNTAISVAGGATFAAVPGVVAVSAGTTGSGTFGATLTLTAGSAFTMAGSSIGTFDLNQNSSFGSAGLVASVASGAPPTLTFEIGSNGTMDILNVSNGVVTSNAVQGVLEFQTPAGATSIAPGDYTFINAASGLGPSAFTLGVTSINVGGSNYPLSLSKSSSTEEVLTITPPYTVAVSWSSPVAALTHLGGLANVGAMLTNNDPTNVLNVGSYSVAGSDPSATITYTNPASISINPGASNAFSFGLATSNATPLGLNTITLTASGSLTISPVTTTTTLTVYSGTSTWAGSGGGSWGAFASGFGVNWGTNQGSPGLDPNFVSTDTATFDSSATGPGGTVTLDGANPSLLSLTFNDSAASYTIAQGSGGTLTLNGGSGAASITVLSGTHAISAPITLATDTNVVVTNSTDSLTISGNIGESPAGQSLTLSGAGTLILSGTNSYSGGTTIASGTLRLGAANTLPTTSDTVAVGGNLDLAGYDQTITGLSGGGTIGSSSGSPNNPAVLTVNGSGSFGGTLANNFGSGSGTVALEVNSGTLVLSGNNTFTGGVTIDGGTLRVGSSGALNSAAPNAVTFGATSGAATLDLYGRSNTTVSGLAVAAAAVTAGNAANQIVTNSQTGTATLNYNGGASTFAGSLQDGGSGKLLALTVSGGTLTLSGTNTYSGATNVSGGTLRIASPGSLGSGSTVSVNSGALGGSGTISGSVSVQANGQLSPSLPTLGGAATMLYIGGNLSLAAGAVLDFTLSTTPDSVSSTPSPNLINDHIAVSGNLSLAGDADNSGTLDISGSVSPGYYELISYTGLAPSTTGWNAIGPIGFTYTFTSDTFLDQFDLHVTAAGGSSSWIRAGNSNYNNSANWENGAIPNGAGQTASFSTGVPTGSITSPPAMIAVDNDLSPTLGSLTFDNPTVSYTLNGGTLTLDSGNSTGGAVSVVSGSHEINSTLILADASRSTTFTIAAGSTLGMLGAIDDSMSVTGQAITLAGGGELDLYLPNTYSGGTTVTGGSLIIEDGANVGSGAGGLTLNGSSASATFLATSSNPVTIGGSLEIDNGGTLNMSSNDGSGIVTVSGQPIFNGGAINVTAGTLVFNNSVAAIGTGAVSVTVSSGATLELAGTASALTSAVTIYNHGSLASTPAGSLQVTGGNQTVGVITGTGTVNGSGATVYDGDTVVSGGANLTATQILQNTLTINAGSTVTIAPAGSEMLAQPAAQGSGTDAATLTRSVSEDSASAAAPSDSSASDPFTAIQAAILSGSITAASGLRLESRIAAIESLAAADPGVNASLLESRVLAVLASSSILSTADASPPTETGSGMLALDSGEIASPSGSVVSGATAAFAPIATFAGSPAAVPEPSTLLLAVLGAIGICLALRHRAA